MSRSKHSYDFTRFLNPALAENPMFRDLFEVVGNVIEDYVTEQVEQLSRITQSEHIRRGDYVRVDGERVRVGHIEGSEPVRPLVVTVNGTPQTITRRVLHDRGVLIGRARNLGLDYFSDTLSDTDYARVVDFVEAFWPHSGKREFIDFIGFMKNARLRIDQLWADDSDPNDEYTFLEPYSSSLQPVYAGGDHYPSSHFQVVYNLLDTQVDLRDLVNLLYLLSPTNYVIHRLVGEATGADEKLRTTVVPHGLQQIESGFLGWTGDALNTTTQLRMGPLHLCVIEAGFLRV